MQYIQAVQDFPKEGMVFRHIGPLIANPASYSYVIRKLLKCIEDVPFDCVGGLDARGLISMGTISEITKKPMFMIRKESKLPGNTIRETYSMEYSEAKSIEVEVPLPGKRVVLIDDILATGGTMRAAKKLVERAGSEVVAVLCIVGIDGLDGEERLRESDSKLRIHTCFNYPAKTVNGGYETPTISEFIPMEVGVRPVGEPLLMWHPSLSGMAGRLLKTSPFTPCPVKWNYFRDGTPNFEFHSEALMNRDLVFLLSMSDIKQLAEQMALLIVLPRHGIRSLSIVIPYLSTATMERVPTKHPGTVATVEPILKMISHPIPLTKTGPANLFIYDIHALPVRFYSTDNVSTKLVSAIPLLKAELKDRVVIAFPDEGAFKRFGNDFEDSIVIVCGKVRGEGDSRKVAISKRINWPADPANVPKTVVIVDDLVQSGNTILSCAEDLRREGFDRISAYVTHAIFPDDSWAKFIDGPIDCFYLANTNPKVTDALEGLKPFKILQLESRIAEDLGFGKICELLRMNPLWRAARQLDIYVASANNDKLTAVFRTFRIPGCRFFQVEGIKSNVPEQPFDQQTEEGAYARLLALEKIVPNKRALLISLESGIMSVNEDASYNDVVCAKMLFDNELTTVIGGRVLIPTSLNGYVELAKRDPSVTFGSRVEAAFGYPKGSWMTHVTGRTRISQLMDVVEQLVGASLEHSEQE